MVSAYAAWHQMVAYQFVRNDDVRRQTQQPKLTAIIQSRRLVWAYYGINDNADAKRIMLASPSADWRRQPGRPRITWLSSQHCPTGSETTPPYASRSSRFGSEPPSVENDIDVWRYAILELHARNDDESSTTTANLEICPLL